MRNLSALVIASFIATTPIAQAEDGSERYQHMLDRVTSQPSDTGSQQQTKTTIKNQQSS